jgi:ribosomal protein L7/L12
MRCCPFCNHEKPFGIRLCPNCVAALPESIGSAQALERWNQEIRALLGEGRKFQAIKLYRPRSGVRLRQAQEALEAIERGEPLSIPEMVDEPSERELAALPDQGQKIKAIKLYWARTGVRLKEAKDAVEAIQRGERLPEPETSDNSFHETLVSLLKQGRKIDSIKVFREVTGSGLKESKDAIESITARHELSGSQRTGCLGLTVLSLVILACHIRPYGSVRGGLASSVYYWASPKPGSDSETEHVVIDCPSQERNTFREPLACRSPL